MSSFDFGIKNLPAYLNLVDKKLKEQVPANITGVARLLAASGKRYRPSLVIAVAYHSGKAVDENVINAAAAIELVHLASLVHDDIIDNGAERWGLPTINSKEGSDTALLAGDFLFAKGCALAARISADAAGVLAKTIVDLCEGQALELADQFNTGRTAESLFSAIKGKTSSIFIASCVLGGLAAGLAASQLKILSRFGENAGIAYQLKDDISDLDNDILEGNYTLPVIMSLNAANGSNLKKLLKNASKNDEQILNMSGKDNSINVAAKEAEKYRLKSLAELKKLDNQKLAAALSSFINRF